MQTQAQHPGLKARRGKRLISRQKKLQKTIPHRNSLQQLPKNRRLRRKTIRGICMQRPFQLVQNEVPKPQTKHGEQLREPNAVCEASRKNTNLHKIGRRIELQNPNGRENQAEMKKQVSCIKYHASCLKSGKKNSPGKSEPDTSSSKAVSVCRDTFLLLIFETHSIKEIGNITFKKRKNGKKLHPPITFFLKKNVISDI